MGARTRLGCVLGTPCKPSPRRPPLAPVELWVPRPCLSVCVWVLAPGYFLGDLDFPDFAERHRLIGSGEAERERGVWCLGI